MYGKRQGFWLSMVGVVTICACLVSSAIADNIYRFKKKMVEQEFSLKAGGKLDVDVEDMDVFVRATQGDKSRVTVFVGGNDEARAVEYFEEHMTFDAKMEGNTLHIESTDPSNGSWRFWEKYEHVDVWVVVEVPVRIDATIRSEDGDLEIEELDGEITIRTADGDIKAPKLSGSTISIRSIDGDIEAKTLTAKGDIEIDTTDGDLVCRNITASRVVLTTTDGDVHIERIKSADIDVSASDGNIELGVEGERLSARCDDGDMTILLYSDMEVELSTGDGDIDVRVPRDMGAELELYGEDVRVSSGINVSGRVSDTRVVGKMNNGGKSIKARTHDGTISLSSRASSK